MINFSIFDEPLNSEVKIPKIFIFLMLLIWVGLIYSPFDTYATEGSMDLFQVFFNRQIVKLSIFQSILLIFVLYLFSFPRSKKINNFQIAFLFLSLIAIIISLFNPNNTFTLSQYLYFPEVFSLYILFLLAIALFYLEDQIFPIIFEKFISTGALVILFKCVQSLLMYFSGHPSLFNGGMPSTIPQMDILIYISIFQLIFLTEYLKTNNKTYLIFIVILLITLFFSGRRSALGVGLASDIFVLIYFISVSPDKKKASQILVASILIPIVFAFVFKFLMPDKFNQSIDRFMGAFSFFTNKTPASLESSDSGHMEQSITTTQVFFQKAGDTFWGSGFGNVPFYIEGQAEDGEEFLGGIHNSFVLAWATWGLHMTLYLVFLFITLFILIIKLLIEKFTDYTVVGILIFLAALLILGWSNGLLFVEHLQYIVVFVFLYSCTKYIPHNKNITL